MARVVGAGLLALTLLGAPCGCGDAPAPPPQGPPGPATTRWNVPPASPAEQVRFALDRMVRGPVPQTLLAIPDQHTYVLRAAKADLLALPLETLALLRDPALIERLTGPATKDLNPWHNVLELISALPQPDAALVRSWVAPIRDHGAPSLLLLGVGCIQASGSDELADLALLLLERGAHDRNVSKEAFRFLAAASPPWPQRALQLLFARGSPHAWVAVAAALDAGGQRGAVAAARANLLAWWALLSEQGGPRIPTGLPRVKTVAYVEAFGRPETPAVAAGTWLPSSRIAYDQGWLTAAPEEAAELPLVALFGTGQEPAALARCALGRLGYEAARWAVEADRAGRDEVRRARAEHCALPGDPPMATDVASRATEDFLASLRAPRATPWTLAEVTEVRRALPPATTPEAVALLRRVVREARPVTDLVSVVETAHDLLRAQERGLDQEAVFELLDKGDQLDPEARSLGVHLAQRSRQGIYLPRLLALEAKASADQARALQRGMHWIVTGGDISAPVLSDYVRRYAERADQASDEVLPTLATGFLDLGEPGVAALVERIHGPRAVIYARALMRASGVLPVAVAEALSQRIDARLSPEARRDLYLALWRGAPAQAAGALAAAKARLDPSERPVVDVVLETVRHRAAPPRE
jgi:hypothetical protein